MNPVEPLTLEVNTMHMGILRNHPGCGRFEVQFEVETALWMYQLIP